MSMLDLELSGETVLLTELIGAEILISLTGKAIAGFVLLSGGKIILDCNTVDVKQINIAMNT